MGRDINQIFWGLYFNQKRKTFRFSSHQTRTFKISICTAKKNKERKRLFIKDEKKQTGGFLNIYDFAYTERDVVNQAGKVAPGVTKGATNETNNIEKQRIDQIILQGGKEVEHVLP